MSLQVANICKCILRFLLKKFKEFRSNDEEAAGEVPLWPN